MNQQQSTLKDLEAFLRDLEFRTSERSFPKSETFKINGCLQELKVTLPLRLFLRVRMGHLGRFLGRDFNSIGVLW